MSWDDEDFEVPTGNKAPTSWEEEANDEPVFDSWDAEEDVAPSKAAEKKSTKVIPNTTGKAKGKKADKKGTTGRALLDIDKVDDKTRRELLRKAEVDSDLNNAADLFGGLGVAEDINEHPREKARRAAEEAANAAPVLTKDTPIDAHPLFQPTTKAEYEKLRKSLAPALTNLSKESLLNYSSGLAIDLIRDVSQPLSIENIRKVISTLNIILKEKEKIERQARLQKAGGTATGGAGKKKAKPAVKTNVNNSFMKDFDDDMDDLGDDDFM